MTHTDIKLTQDIRLLDREELLKVDKGYLNRFSTIVNFYGMKGNLVDDYDHMREEVESNPSQNVAKTFLELAREMIATCFRHSHELRFLAYTEDDSEIKEKAVYFLNLGNDINEHLNGVIRKLENEQGIKLNWDVD